MTACVKGLWLAGAVLALAGCEKPDNAPGPGGLSIGDARALDEAARAIDARQPPAELLQPFSAQWPSQSAAEERGAEDRASGD